MESAPAKYELLFETRLITKIAIYGRISQLD